MYREVLVDALKNVVHLRLLGGHGGMVRSLSGYIVFSAPCKGVDVTF